MLGPRAFAGTAAFVPEDVRIVRGDHEGLWIFNPNPGTEVAFVVPAEVGSVKGCKLTASDRHLFVSSGHNIFAWDKDQWLPWWSAPEQQPIVDIAFDAKNERLLVLTTAEHHDEPEWWIVPREGGEGRRVYNRRAGGAVSPVFDSLGGLYFALDGDVWKGTVETAGTGEEMRLYIEARRLWPVAIRETSEGTPGGSGADEIVPLDQHLVLELSRYGGSGWGDIIRLPNHDAYENQLSLKWERLEDCSLGSSSALAPSGKMAAIYNNGLKSWSRIDVKSGELKRFE